MLDSARELTSAAMSAIAAADTLVDLESIKVAFLGKKGKLTLKLKEIANLSEQEKIQFGSYLNNAKKSIHEQIAAKKAYLMSQKVKQQLLGQAIDPTLPGVGIELGSLHPITLTLEFAVSLFEKLGFDILSGPEIEDDYHNFEALNIPRHHPARAMHDTFYFNDGKLLRTHTSTIQIRAMQRFKPPYKFIAIGKVYRCDHDVTHTPMFHQLEGLLVNQGVNFSNLIDILTEFLRAFFANSNLIVKFRPSYFPFTEPSAEVDMQCVICNAAGCKVCKYSGWLEILGCGMVHPEVLRHGKVDPDLSGWAFGIGIDRLAMLRYGIDDLRMMFENDLRFLKQFKGG